MAFELSIPRPAGFNSLNADRLDEDLRAEFGEAVDGLAVDTRHVRVIFFKPPTEAEAARAHAVVQAHNPAQLSARQRARADKANQAAAVDDRLQEINDDVAWNKLTAAGKLDALRNYLRALASACARR